MFLNTLRLTNRLSFMNRLRHTNRFRLVNRLSLNRSLFHTGMPRFRNRRLSLKNISPLNLDNTFRHIGRLRFNRVRRNNLWLSKNMSSLPISLINRIRDPGQCLLANTLRPKFQLHAIQHPIQLGAHQVILRNAPHKRRSEKSNIAPNDGMVIFVLYLNHPNIVAIHRPLRRPQPANRNPLPFPHNLDRHIMKRPLKSTQNHLCIRRCKRIAGLNSQDISSSTARTEPE